MYFVIMDYLKLILSMVLMNNLVNKYFIYKKYYKGNDKWDITVKNCAINQLHRAFVHTTEGIYCVDLNTSIKIQIDDNN